MALRLYNTMAKREVEMTFDTKRPLTMYSCGPTVYGRPHIGNYASFLMADLLRRWLEVKGFKVMQVKNITDVGHLVRDSDSGEDKIEKQARKEFGEVSHESVLKVARTYEEMFLEDERVLNILPPHHRPRATEYIEEMKRMIETLLERGFAYVTDDGIYFDVTKKTETPYGALSGNRVEDLCAGIRVDVNEGKRCPADFALWKFCTGQNEHHVLRWKSPKGKNGELFPDGFPGWHIECSAMSRSLLGDQIDIHTGGEDNIFPHHECEIAQTEAVTEKRPFVRCWVHRRRIDLAGEKMSKSLGNLLHVSDILERGYDAMDLRYYLLSVHYRTNLKFTWEGLDLAKKTREKIMQGVERFEELQKEMLPIQLTESDQMKDKRISEHIEIINKLHQEKKQDELEGTRDQFDLENKIMEDVSLREAMKWEMNFVIAMDGDLNVSSAIASLIGMSNWFFKDGVCNPLAKKRFMDFIGKIRQTFGCFDVSALKKVEESLPTEIQMLLEQRSAARKKKDFAESDRLRLLLADRGYHVKDTPSGQNVVKK